MAFLKHFYTHTFWNKIQPISVCHKSINGTKRKIGKRVAKIKFSAKNQGQISQECSHGQPLIWPSNFSIGDYIPKPDRPLLNGHSYIVSNLMNRAALKSMRTYVNPNRIQNG